MAAWLASLVVVALALAKRFSEIFRIRFLNRNGQESAEKCSEVLRTVPPFSVTPLLHLQALRSRWRSRAAHASDLNIPVPLAMPESLQARQNENEKVGRFGYFFIFLCLGERENVCNSQETGVRTRYAAIVNHPAVLKILRVVNLLRVLFLVRRVPSLIVNLGPPKVYQNLVHFLQFLFPSNLLLSPQKGFQKKNFFF